MKKEHTEQEFREAAKNSFSIAGMCRYLGRTPFGSSNYKLIHEKIKEYNIDTSHFTGQGWNVGLKFVPSKSKPIEEILVKNSTYKSSNFLRERLIKEGLKEHKCENPECGLTEWHGKPIPLELHHINGDNTDNRLENLQILCPNCHAQTDNYCSKNKENKRLSEEKKEVYKICKTCGNRFVPKRKNQIFCSEKCYHDSIKKIDANKEELKKLLLEYKNFSKIGRLLGISDNAVRKLCKKYGLPYKTKDI